MKGGVLKKINKGFTLIELLVVISIIGLLSSIVMANLVTARQKALDSATLQNFKQLQTAMELYKDSNGHYITPNYDSHVCDQNMGECSMNQGSYRASGMLSKLVEDKYISSLDFLDKLGVIIYIYDTSNWDPEQLQCGGITDKEYLFLINVNDSAGNFMNLPLPKWSLPYMYCFGV